MSTLEPEKVISNLIQRPDNMSGSKVQIYCCLYSMHNEKLSYDILFLINIKAMLQTGHTWRWRKYWRRQK